MKKIIAALAAFFTALSVSVCAYAATKLYEIPELYLEMDIPMDWIVITRDMDKNAQYIESIGLDPEELMQRFRTDNMYLVAVNGRENCEYSVLGYRAAGAFDISELDDAKIQKLVKSFDDSAEARSMQMKTESSGTFEAGGRKFISMVFAAEEDGKTMCSMRYVTIYNGLLINICAVPYDGVLTDGIRSDMDTLVQGFRVTKQIEKPGVFSEIGGFISNNALLIGLIALILVIYFITVSVNGRYQGGRRSSGLKIRLRGKNKNQDEEDDDDEDE